MTKVKSLLVPVYMTIAPTKVRAPHLHSTLLLQQIPIPLCCSVPVHALLPPALFPCKFNCCFPWAAIADCPNPHSAEFSTLITLPCTLGHFLSMLPIHTLRLYLHQKILLFGGWRERVVTASSVGRLYSLMQLDQVLIWARTKMKGQCCCRQYGTSHVL